MAGACASYAAGSGVPSMLPGLATYSGVAVMLPNRVGAARRTLITATARRPGMARYDVQAVIGNKPGLSDPEGSTILEDLVLKGGAYSGVSAVRTAKMLRFTVSAPSARAAAATVRRLCDELRIYNPLVSELSVTASAAGGGRGQRRASN